MEFRKIHLLFEQSGTFKNEFKKLGFANSFDYDILNDFGETDFKIDLFNEIEKAYRDRESIFDKMNESDLIFAFFPCIRFECQIQLFFRGEAHQQAMWSDLKKVEHSLKLHNELNHLYNLICKLVIVCLKRNLKLIIENPYNQNYLEKFFPIKPKVIDLDRSENGDYFKKPTQFWFINCEPKYNLIFEPKIINNNLKKVSNTSNKVERSLISKEYANRFIRTYIMDEK